ncbi:hypothetical protein ACQBAR_06665 [Propionibacteriaceae bacterium Y1685]
MMTTFDLDTILADALMSDGPSESSEPDSTLEALVRLSEDRAAVFTPGGTHDEDDRLISEDFYELMVDPTTSEQKTAQQNQPMMMPPMALGGRGADVPAGGRGVPSTGGPGVGAAGSGAAAVGPGGGVGHPAPGALGSVPGAGAVPGASGGLGSGGLGSGGFGSPLAGSVGTSAAGVDSTGSPYDTGIGRSGLAAPTPSALDTDRSAGTNTAGLGAGGVGTGLHDRVSSGPVESGAGSTSPYGAGMSSSPSAGSVDAPFAAGGPSGMPTGAELGGGVPGGGAAPSMPAGGAAGLGAGGAGLSGTGLGGTGLGGDAAPTTDTRKWSVEDLSADGQLWDQLAQSHDRTVIADRILTESKAQSGVIGPASTNIRANLLALERLAGEAHVAMTEIADLLKLTARTKSETEATNTAAAARTNGDPR